MCKEISIPDAMDILYELGKSCETTEAPDRIAAQASLMPRDVAIIALARLYVIAETRARFANAKLTAVMDKNGEKI
ncbi:MAG: hypothetical protein K2H64_12850 [Desulfovibrio sp.]|nr:hypothetical protein [Desulfovibrio sp.]